MRARVLAPGLLLAIVACAAHAQEEGWYAGAAFGVTDVGVSESLWRDSNLITDVDLDTRGFGWQAYAGYRLHRHFGIEVGAHGYGDTDFSANSTATNSIWNPGALHGRTEVRGMSVALMAIWPGDERPWQYYGKAGMLFFNSAAKYDSTINDVNHANDDGGLPLFALGVQRRMWGRWSARAEWQYTMATIASRQTVDIHFLSLGLMHPLP